MIRSAQEMIEMMAKSGQLPEKRDPVIANLITLRPTIQNLKEILEIDPTSLSPSDRIDYLTVFEKHLNWLHSKMQDAIIAVAGDRSIEPETIFDGTEQSEREDVATALRISPEPLHKGTFHTYEDHRLATAGAMIGLRIDGMQVENIATTKKTITDFPGLWNETLNQGAL